MEKIARISHVIAPPAHRVASHIMAAYEKLMWHQRKRGGSSRLASAARQHRPKAASARNVAA